MKAILIGALMAFAEPVASAQDGGAPVPEGCQRYKDSLELLKKRHPDSPASYAGFEKQLNGCMEAHRRPAPWNAKSPGAEARLARIKAMRTEPAARRIAWSAVLCESAATKAQFTKATDVRSAQITVEVKRGEENAKKAAAQLAAMKVAGIDCADAMVSRVAACVHDPCDDTEALEYTESLDCVLLRKPWTLPPWRCR